MYQRSAALCKNITALNVIVFIMISQRAISVPISLEQGELFCRNQEERDCYNTITDTEPISACTVCVCGCACVHLYVNVYDCSCPCTIVRVLYSTVHIGVHTYMYMRIVHARVPIRGLIHVYVLVRIAKEHIFPNSTLRTYCTVK